MDQPGSTYRPPTLADIYGQVLLASLGVGAGIESAVIPPQSSTEKNYWHEAHSLESLNDWAQSGLMYLTGDPSLPPALGPGHIPTCARGALQALTLVCTDLTSTDLNPLQAQLAALNGAMLLTERAAILGLKRQGNISPNGTCQMIKLRDGWLALNLARADDWQLLPAWLQTDTHFHSWQQIHAALAPLSLASLVEQGRLLGLAISTPPATSQDTHWFNATHTNKRNTQPNSESQPLIVDLSALWAGPLCSHLLQLAGARVIKIESQQRPDGARLGSAAFYQLLNNGKHSVVLNLHEERGRRQLQQLINHADIVIEGSRPRALRQLGIDAAAIVNNKPGLVWLSITGYGRQEPEANWIAYGDDAAVAAGITQAATQSTTHPTMQQQNFCGDALCDPLTGIHAALAAQSFWRNGIGAVLDISLVNVAKHCVNFAKELPLRHVLKKDEKLERWFLARDHQRIEIQLPHHRSTVMTDHRLGSLWDHLVAKPLGADTEQIFSEFNISC